MTTRENDELRFQPAQLDRQNANMTTTEHSEFRYPLVRQNAIIFDEEDDGDEGDKLLFPYRQLVRQDGCVDHGDVFSFQPAQLEPQDANPPTPQLDGEQLQSEYFAVYKDDQEHSEYLSYLERKATKMTPIEILELYRLQQGEIVEFEDTDEDIFEHEDEDNEWDNFDDEELEELDTFDLYANNPLESAVKTEAFEEHIRRFSQLEEDALPTLNDQAINAWYTAIREGNIELVVELAKTTVPNFFEYTMDGEFRKSIWEAIRDGVRGPKPHIISRDMVNILLRSVIPDEYKGDVFLELYDQCCMTGNPASIFDFCQVMFMFQKDDVNKIPDVLQYIVTKMPLTRMHIQGHSDYDHSYSCYFLDCLQTMFYTEDIYMILNDNQKWHIKVVGGQFLPMSEEPTPEDDSYERESTSGWY
jgi:hypothetical protein